MPNNCNLFFNLKVYPDGSNWTESGYTPRNVGAYSLVHHKDLIMFNLIHTAKWGHNWG